MLGYTGDGCFIDLQTSVELGIGQQAMGNKVIFQS
jgi:hypothetical protein